MAGGRGGLVVRAFLSHDARQTLRGCPEEADSGEGDRGGAEMAGGTKAVGRRRALRGEEQEARKKSIAVGWRLLQTLAAFPRFPLPLPLSRARRSLAPLHGGHWHGISPAPTLPTFSTTALPCSPSLANNPARQSARTSSPYRASSPPALRPTFAALARNARRSQFQPHSHAPPP